MVTAATVKSSVPLRRGVESLFGTRDENIRLLEEGLHIRTRILNDTLEIEGETAGVSRAEHILEDYFNLIHEGHLFHNGDLNSFLRVVVSDEETTLRGLVLSGKQRSFGKKVLAPKTINQRRYIDAIERNDLVFGIGPAGTGKTYLAVAMAVSAMLAKRITRIVLTRPAVEAGERLGVLPPIARLTPDQAVYHFMSGYTSKIAGTEIGLGTEPEITFSACFGAPFMVHHPYKYAQMLKAKLLKHAARVWLVNTGWTGGPFGVGKRISIQHTRALLNAALSGDLDNVEYWEDPLFRLAVPKHCSGVPESILDPANTWPSREEYQRKYDTLAARFVENFRLMTMQENIPVGLEEGGPRRR